MIWGCSGRAFPAANGYRIPGCLLDRQEEGPQVLSLTDKESDGNLSQWVLNCGSRTGSITWELAANPNSQALPNPKLWQLGAQQTVYTGHFDPGSSLGTSGLVYLAKDS